MNAAFKRRLMDWNTNHNKRIMPWKGEKDPYLIWLSEIILQQTRTEQGLPYFNRFKERYPTIKKLANASEDEVMRLWQGLGYYSRARNLHHTAKFISNELNGKFPDNLEGLKSLKGVGDYTAAAIASFAFGRKAAVVDGNVIRVLARVFGVAEPYDSGRGKKYFASLASELIDEKMPGEYNQAIMDFGATICVPKSPSCKTCPLGSICIAHKQNLVDVLPYREKRTAMKNIYLNYIFVRFRNSILVEQRTGKGIWRNLYQLPLIETPKRATKRELEQGLVENFRLSEAEFIAISEEQTQLLTHRKVHFRFIEFSISGKGDYTGGKAQFVKLSELSRYAFPRTIHLYLTQKGLL